MAASSPRTSAVASIAHSAGYTEAWVTGHHQPHKRIPMLLSPQTVFPLVGLEVDFQEVVVSQDNVQ